MIWVSLGTSLSLYSQNNIVGTFFYSTDDRKEVIILKPDSTFLYYGDRHQKYTIEDCSSYWSINDSLLILNSNSPQRILVFEERNQKSKTLTLTVFPSNFPNINHFSYDLHTITKEGDTLSFYDQTKKL